MISSPVYLHLVSLKQNAEEKPESYLSMSVWKCVYIYKFRIILVLTQLEATALRVSYSYNSISASLDVLGFFFQKCSNGVSASCSTSCRRGKVYVPSGYFSPTDLTYYINRTKFISCYWVSPTPSLSSRETKALQKDEMEGEASAHNLPAPVSLTLCCSKSPMTVAPSPCQALRQC